jgi:hypothetical protein
MSSRSWFRFAAAALLALGGSARADEPAARVLALEGSATANGASLAVGDPIASGATIQTTSGSRVGILASQIYVQLDPESSLQLDRDASGQVQMALTEGRARVVDTRADPTAAKLKVVDTTASIAGGDSEYYILAEKGGRYAMFCEWSGPLTVTRDPKTVTAGPNQCVLAKPHEPIYAAQGHDHQIPLLPLPADVVFAPEFNPDVAAGPQGLAFDPLLPIDIARDPCDVPGSGCRISAAPIVVEPPPDPGGCAPGVACN